MDKLEDILLNVNRYKKKYIFGAQATAYGIYRALKIVFGINIDGFVVSDTKNNLTDIEDISVIGINDMDKVNSYTFIAVPEYLHSEIISLLQCKDKNNYCCIDTALEYKFMRELFRTEKKFVLLEDVEECESRVNEKQIAIYTAVSSKDKNISMTFPKGDIFKSVHAGAAIDSALCSDYRDNDGDNISDKNRNYAELTVTYWAWKNRKDEYKGIAHYRRYLKLCERDWKAFVGNDIDVVLPLPFVCYPTAESQYGRYNHRYVINNLFKVLEKRDLNMAAAAKEILRGEYIYQYNMLIAKKEVFDAYCDWIFPILSEVDELCEKWSEENNPDRLCGHLGEILTTLFFMLNKDKYKIVHTEKVWLV